MGAELRFFLLGLALLSSLGLSQAGEKEATDASGTFTLRVDVNMVEVPVTVIDKNGHPVKELRADDFQVYEDGVRQEIKSLVVDRAPARVVLLVDFSMSVQQEAKDIRRAAYNFARALSQGSQLAVIGFSDDVQVLQDWTSSLRSVNKALKKLQAGFRTALYDAIYLAAADLLRGVSGKKAIILLTDGLDNESRISYGQAQEELARSQAALYIISLTRMVAPEVERSYRIQILANLLAKLGEKDAVKRYFEQKEKELERLAGLSGGRIYFPLNMSQLGQAYNGVASEIENRYSLTYISSNKSRRGDFRRIRVVYKNPEAQVLHRAGYYVTR